MKTDKYWVLLKFGTIKSYYLPTKNEAYKAITKLERREEALREGKGGERREHWDKDCLELCLRAITKAPKGTLFVNDSTDEKYTKNKALDYIINYGIDY